MFTEKFILKVSDLNDTQFPFRHNNYLTNIFIDIDINGGVVRIQHHHFKDEIQHKILSNTYLMLTYFRDFLKYYLSTEYHELTNFQLRVADSRISKLIYIYL